MLYLLRFLHFLVFGVAKNECQFRRFQGLMGNKVNFGGKCSMPT